jgi:hypothetical protein
LFLSISLTTRLNSFTTNTPEVRSLGYGHLFYLQNAEEISDGTSKDRNEQNSKSKPLMDAPLRELFFVRWFPDKARSIFQAAIYDIPSSMNYGSLKLDKKSQS